MASGDGGFVTSWTLVTSAAAGDTEARSQFFRTYLPLVRAYLWERWRNTPLASEVDDVAQDVFLECFKEASALDRVDPARSSGFRGFLIGIVRHNAQHAERRTSRARKRWTPHENPDELPGREARLSQVLDREWALMLVAEARRLMQQRATASGAAAMQRLELLVQRFSNGLSIREIAARQGEDPARLHHEYARARSEFAACLGHVVDQNAVRAGRDLDAECQRIMELFA